MKKASKVLIFISVLIIIVSTFAMPVSAAGVSHYCTSASGAKGDTVTVSVKMSGGVALWGTQVSLSYNSSELQYVSSSKGGLVASGSLNHSGTKVTFAGQLNTSQSSKGGTIFTVNFKILKDSGKSTLTVIPSGIAGDHITEDGTAVSVSSSNGAVTVTKPVTNIKLDKSDITLKKGESTQLTATVTPSDATNKTVTYYTSNSKVATVSSNGKITAVGGGTAVITAKAGAKSTTCKVFVKVAQTGIKTYGETSREVIEGENIKLSVVKVPSDATDKNTIQWMTSDEQIAKVSADGTVTATAPGTVIITAKSNTWTVEYMITVVENEETTEAPTSETTENVSDTSTTEEYSLVEPVANEAEQDFKDSEAFLYIAVIAAAVVSAVVSGTVSFFVAKGYYGAKNKENF